MEQHYSNLVQKYLANTLTASEQMELAALSRLYGPRQQMLGGMVIVDPFMLVEEGMAEQEEMEEMPVQVEEHHPEEEAKEEKLPQRETIFIHQQAGKDVFEQIHRQTEEELAVLEEIDKQAEEEGNVLEDIHRQTEEKEAVLENIHKQAEEEQNVFEQIPQQTEEEENVFEERHRQAAAAAEEEEEVFEQIHRQQGETILIQQQDDEDDFEEVDQQQRETILLRQRQQEEEEDENTPAPKSPPDHEFSYLSLAYGTPPSRKRQLFEQLDSRISNWTSKPATIPSAGSQVFEQLESRISSWNSKPNPQSPPSRNRQMFEQLESRVASWKDGPEPGWKDRQDNGWKNGAISGETPPRRKVLLFFATSVTAVAVLCFFYYWQFSYKAQQRVKEMHNRQHISPGTNKATLILSDGSAIGLSDRRDGLLTIQGGIEVLKSGDFMLEYKIPATGVKDVVSNTIATPRGGIYQLSLPDGSHITLNAASSLTFPTVFNGPVREVVLTGEAFFEVAEDTARPFRVKAGETVVEAIGTSFNIQSYTGEPQQTTTMVSGSVKLNALGVAHIIRPGEQAVLHYDSRRVQVRNANVEEEVAWKNGKFRFFNRSAASIINQAARWYNMDVEWEDDVEGVLLSADTSRDAPLSGLLEMLEASGQVHFKTENKRIVVYRGRW